MSRLEIIELRLENYRQYKGENTIDLQTEGEKNINVIEGQNGAGKSNILNAITLCLYGKETHLEEQEDSGLESYPYVNRKSLAEIDENGTAEGEIELILGDDEPQYIFRRIFKTVKLPGGGYSSQYGDLELKEKSGQDWKSVDQVHTRLNQILPVHVHEYFLFDGERLDEFFGEGYQERVKDGLLDVSHIELLENSIDHLGTIEKETERDLDDVGGEAEQKRKEYENAQKKQEDLEKDLEQTKTDIEDTRNRIKEIDKKLQDSSDPDVREKQQRREHLTERLEEKRDDIKRLYGEASSNLVEAGPPLYAGKSLDYTLSELKELSEKGELPPKIQDTFVNELLQKGQCICGEELTEDHRDHLQSLRRDMSSVAEENLEGKIIIPNIQEEALEEVETLVEKRRQLAAAEKKENQINKELNDISEELQAYDIPDNVDVQELENQRKEYENQLSDLTEKKGRLEAEIEQAKEQVEKKKKAFNKAASKREENSELLKRIEFLETSRDELASVKEEILASVRSEIEERMNEYFNEIIWKKEQYSVTLEDDYQVKVRGPREDNKIGSLSAGERQVLAFSFLAALTRVSGFNAPLVIDTPLGRISSTPKKRLARNLPEYVENTQVTFLMTDEEYTDDVRVNMKPSVSNEYKIEFADEVSEVVSYE